MVYFTVSDAWKASYPGASAGVLVLANVTNPAQHAGLEQHKEALQDELRARFAGQDRSAIGALPELQAYERYYRRFKKTYHVQLQLESLVLKGKAIPGVAGLVESMFMAELHNLLLTAGHDLERLQLPVHLDVARGSERYMLLRGQEQDLKAGDMYMYDGAGVISSILYGPDQRTQIHAGTRQVMFTVYAPPGIDPQAVQRHLDEIEANVRLIAPQAERCLSQVFVAA